MLNKCIDHLKQVLKDKLNYDNPTVRQSCSQVLSEYNLWSIHENCLKTDPTFDSTLNLIQQNDYKFFAEYFNAKYEGIEQKLENIHLNS